MKPIDLNFKPSFILSTAIFLVAAMSSWIIYFVDLSLSLQSLCLLLIWLAAIDVIIGDALMIYPWSPTRLYINAKNELNVIRKDGQILSDVLLQNDSVITPMLTIVHFQSKHTAWYQRLLGQRLVILPDSVDAEGFRQLRVWLVWGERRK